MANPEVAEDMSATMGRRIQPTYGYYRQPNGWITVSPITRLERVRYIEQGWQHLAAYGAFDFSPYVASHPFEGLLMFGGAKELPVEQILQTGLHLNPPRVPRCKQHMTQFHRSHTEDCWRGSAMAEFPQLAGVSPGLLSGFPCEFCDRVLPTGAARKQHQQVAHAKEQNNIQMGRSLAEAMPQPQQATVAQPDISALLERISFLERQEKERERKRTNTAKARIAKKTISTS